MSTVFNILHVEDSCDDAVLVRLALLRSKFPCDIRCVDTELDFLTALEAQTPDAILCDYDMPRFSAERAFAILREKSIDAPFIVVSNHVGRVKLMADMQAGVEDYVAKRDLGRLSDRITAALDRRREALSAP